MGLASFVVSKYGATGSRDALSTNLRTSGAFVTTTTAATLQDAVGNVILASGEIIEVSADEAMRISFGGVAATATTGFPIPALETRRYECNNPGLVSIVDVA
jgi:hypothetical protein